MINFCGAHSMSGTRTAVANEIKIKRRNHVLSISTVMVTFMNLQWHYQAVQRNAWCNECNTGNLLASEEVSSQRCSFASVEGEAANNSPGMRVLCPRGWAVKAKHWIAFWTATMPCELLWKESLDLSKDQEMICQICRAALYMDTYLVSF